MTDTTTAPSGSVEATPMSFDQGVSAIKNLLGDVPDDDRPDSVEDATAKPAANVTEQPAGDDDDVLLSALDDEGSAEEVETSTEAPATIPDTAMVTLADGTSISIADLKTNGMFQRVFTKKTEELKAEKTALHEEHQRKVSEAENEIRQKRDLILENYHLIVPKEPVYDPNDPVGFIEETAMYQERMRMLNGLWQQKQQEEHQMSEKQQAELADYVAEQKQLLVQKLPHLKDEGKREAFRKDITDIGGKVYGVTSEEVNAIADARYMQILHDAIAYQKLKAKAATVPKQVAAKPRLVQQQRMAPQAIQDRDRQGRFESLRKSGSIDAAARAIEDLL
jgi:copper chaperone CopZ